MRIDSKIDRAGERLSTNKRKTGDLGRGENSRNINQNATTNTVVTITTIEGIVQQRKNSIINS